MTELSFTAERQELAAALRWAARLGWQSGICNHFSLAVDDEHILVNPQGRHWSEVTASSLVLLDGDDNVVEGEGTVEETAFFVHVPIHRRVPSARCVLHGHTPYATAITCSTAGRLQYCHQGSLKFYDRVAYDDAFNGVVVTREEGDRIAAALGNRQILFMAHHGITVTGATVAEAFDDFYYLEEACRFQVLAMSMGAPLKLIDDETARKLAPGFMGGDAQTFDHFKAIMRILDREEPEYRI
jgi:ribulose-5-phosphate 4-epimerase/fuculose-1-phosphate aldolase